MNVLFLKCGLEGFTSRYNKDASIRHAIISGCLLVSLPKQGNFEFANLSPDENHTKPSRKYVIILGCF